MRKIIYIIIHCSATRATMNIDKADIVRWHIKERGWSQVGYHYLIRRDGTLRELVKLDEDAYLNINEIANGAVGYNNCSIHICLAGGLSDIGTPTNNFAAIQFTTLVSLLKELKDRYPDVKIIGHNEISNKACPCFDVPLFLRNYGIK